MVEVAARVWDHWRELEEQFAEPAVVLLFSSTLTRDRALEVLARAAGEVIEDLAASNPDVRPGEDEFWTGHWSLAPVPEGVALRIDEEPDDFEGLVQGIADKLGSEGVGGTFDLYQPKELPRLPDVIDLIECRLRVRGEHCARGLHSKPGWRADPGALTVAAEAGIAWCLGNGPGLPLSLQVSLGPRTTLLPDDDLHGYVRQGLELTAKLGVTNLTSIAPDRFRTMAVNAAWGRVTLIEGGTTIETAGWQPSVQRLRTAMTSAAEWATYGFIKRGSRSKDAELAWSLFTDWVPITSFNPQNLSAEAFENELVPDAFGIQLLGATHRVGVPKGPGWTSTETSPGARIVEHTEPEAWFDGRLVPFGGSFGKQVLIPRFLASARADFADSLLTDETLLNAMG